MKGPLRIENWIAGLEEDDRVITCTIVRGEILFGIGKLPEDRRRTELRKTGDQLLASLRPEPVPELTGGFHAVVEVARRQRGPTLEENDHWVIRNSDFAGIDGLSVVTPE